MPSTNSRVHTSPSVDKATPASLVTHENSACTNSSATSADLEWKRMLLQLILQLLEQQTEIMSLLAGKSIYSPGNHQQQLTINENNIVIPKIEKKTIPVYYNGHLLDDWVEPYLSDLANQLGLPIQFRIIERLPTKQEPLAIYLVHLVSGRAEEFVKRDRLQNFMKAFDRKTVILLRQGTQAATFDTLPNNMPGFNVECLSLYYYQGRATLLEKSSAHLAKLNNFLC